MEPKDVRVGDRVKVKACSTGFWAVVQEVLPRQFGTNGVQAVYVLANEDGTPRGEYARSEFVVPRQNCRLLSIGHRAILGTAVERLNESDQLVLQAEIP
jgi:hypothetical protein